MQVSKLTDLCYCFANFAVKALFYNSLIEPFYSVILPIRRNTMGSVQEDRLPQAP
jgi:hypothetical protein